MEAKIGDILRGLTIPVSPTSGTGEEQKLSAVKKRLTDSAVSIITDPATIEEAMFQHSIFCQTYLPYRDPGDGVTL